jgi:predicted transcriptional regulator
MGRAIINLTVEIVCAHVAANHVSIAELPGLILDVYQALASVGHVHSGPSKAEPSVTAQKSVFTDHLVCLDCGESFKALKRHLGSNHGLTPDDYRAKWGLPMSYPMVAAEHTATRSKIALETGLGRKVGVRFEKRGAVRPD